MKKMVIQSCLLFLFLIITNCVRLSFQGPPSFASTCTSILISGPYINKPRGISGAVFDHKNQIRDNRPVFIGPGGRHLFYSDDDARWYFEMTQFDAHSMFVSSSAFHPVDIRGTWNVFNGTTIQPYPDTRVVCTRGPPTIASTCRSILISGPYIEAQRAISGAVFDHTNQTRDNRPVFTGPGGRYLYYSDNLAMWFIGVKSFGAYYMIVSSSTFHPVDIRGIWNVVDGTTRQPYPDIRAVCTRGPPTIASTCTSILISGPYIETQYGISGAVFDHTNQTRDNRPSFIGPGGIYLYYRDDQAMWFFRVKPFGTPFMFVSSSAFHPVDIRGTWNVFNGTTHQLYPDTHAVCTRGPPTIATTCTSILISGPYIKELGGILGAVFDHTNQTGDNRPMFIGPGGRYLYYRDDLAMWLIGEKSFRTRTMFVSSSAFHPVDIRGTWSFSNGTTAQPYPDTRPVCTGGTKFMQIFWLTSVWHPSHEVFN